jgi:hypothetical protein
VTAEGIDWLELITGMACNCRCLLCPATYRGAGSSDAAGASQTMTRRQIARELRFGRARGATGLWLGGGEPTLHPDLPATLALANRLGYERIRVQTNGLRCAYAAYAQRLMGAVRLLPQQHTPVSVSVAMSVMAGRAEVHDQATQTPGAFGLMVSAIHNLLELGATVEADVLLSTHSVPDLPLLVDRFVELGVSSFTFWWASLHGLDARRCAPWIPSLSTLVPQLERAFDHAEALGVRATTLHTPPCVLSPQHRHRYAHAGTWRLLVVLPDGERFMAERSPMEGGHYLAGCARCVARPDCLGLRHDYVQRHGAGEFEPLASFSGSGGAAANTYSPGQAML